MSPTQFFRPFATLPAAALLACVGSQTAIASVPQAAVPVELRDASRDQVQVTLDGSAFLTVLALTPSGELELLYLADTAAGPGDHVLRLPPTPVRSSSATRRLASAAYQECDGAIVYVSSAKVLPAEVSAQGCRWTRTPYQHAILVIATEGPPVLAGFERYRPDDSPVIDENAHPGATGSVHSTRRAGLPRSHGSIARAFVARFASGSKWGFASAAGRSR